MSELRVAFVSDVYFPRVNGVSTSIRTFRTDLEALGVATSLVAPRYEVDAADGSAYAPDPGDPCLLRVAGSRVPGDPEDRRMRWRALTTALASLRERRIDLVHIHTPFLAHYAGVRFARAAGVPCLATYHTFFEEYLHLYVPVLPRAIGRYLARRFTRSQCADVQALIAPSEPMRAVLAAYGIATPVHVVPTGLPAECFRPGDGDRFRTQAGIALNRPLLTYIGRVAHEKNIEFLIEVFVKVRATVPDAMLVIAGEGPARESLRQRVAQLGLTAAVHFAGYLSRDRELLDCYAAASAFVFASRTETQGLVLLEAMAQGVPVVSTAELGTRSILKPESGAIVVPERGEEFAAAAVRVLTDTTLRRELGARGLRYAHTWSSQAMARRLVEVYRGLVERGLQSAPLQSIQAGTSVT